MFDFVLPPILMGLVAPTYSYRLIVKETIMWSDLLVKHKHPDPTQRFVSCIKLIHHKRLERQLYVKTNDNVTLIASERITDNIESLSLPTECIEELHRQGYIIAKVYD